MAYPADVDIITPKVPNTPLLQFYSNIIASSNPINIIFTGLVRGLQYHIRCNIQSTQGDPTLRTSSNATLEYYTSVSTSNSTNINIMPVVPQATQCAQFQFTSEPGQSTRNAITNYCQRLYSTPGWWKNGCIICTDSAMQYYAPGLMLPNSTYCNVTTAPKSRLRFLDTTTTATTSTTINPANVTAYNPAVHSVCPVAHPICATDVSGSKNYNDYFTQLITDLKSTDSFKATLSIINVPITQPTIIVTDNVAPDLTKLNFAITSSAKTGSVSWTASYSAGAVVCYWQISAGTNSAAPTFNSVKGCTDPSWCGMFKSSNNTQTYSTNANNLKQFSASTSYTVYLACQNDIPYAQKMSVVQAVGTFTIPPDTVTPPPTNTTTTSSSFVSISITYFVFLLALLFN